MGMSDSLRFLVTWARITQKKIIVFIKLCTYAALVVVYTVYYKPIHLTAAEKKTSQVDFYNRLTSMPIYPFCIPNSVTTSVLPSTHQ